jgi:DNA polymerase zeta
MAGGLGGLGARALAAFVADEASLLWAVAALVRAWDADLLVSWDAQGAGLGLLLERAAAVGVGLGAALSRTPFWPGPADRRGPAPSAGAGAGAGAGGPGGASASASQAYAERHDSGISVPGRIVLNGWRVVKGEVKLASYTQEAVAWATLGRRAPHFPQRTLHDWWDGPGGSGARQPSPSPSPSPAPAPAPESLLMRSRAADYMVARAAITLQVSEAQARARA